LKFWSFGVAGDRGPLTGGFPSVNVRAPRRSILVVFFLALFRVLGAGAGRKSCHDSVTERAFSSPRAVRHHHHRQGHARHLLVTRRMVVFLPAGLVSVRGAIVSENAPQSPSPARKPVTAERTTFPVPPPRRPTLYIHTYIGRTGGMQGHGMTRSPSQHVHVAFLTRQIQGFPPTHQASQPRDEEERPRYQPYPKAKQPRHKAPGMTGRADDLLSS
jgi:hypothetical protein